MLFSGLCSPHIHTIGGSAAGKQASHRGEVKNTFSEHIALNSGDWVSAYWDKQIECAIMIILFSKGEFSPGSCHPINILCRGLTFHCLYFASPSGISGGDKLTIDDTMSSRGQMALSIPINKDSTTLDCLLPSRYPEIWISTLAESRVLMFSTLSCLVRLWGPPASHQRRCNIILQESSTMCFYCVAVGLQKTVMA